METLGACKGFTVYLPIPRQIRSFSAADVTHLLEEGQELASDLESVLSTIRRLVLNHAGPPRLRLDHAEVMIELDRLLFHFDNQTFTGVSRPSQDDAMD